MTRYTTEISAVNGEGTAVDLSAKANVDRANGSPKKYSPVKPDYYYAVLTGIEYGKPYRGKWGAFINPNSPDGKWNYEKIVPKFTLLNDNNSEIERQDFTLGVLEAGKFVRPDGKKQSPIMVTAQYLLTALGLFKATEDPAKFSLDVNFELVQDRVIRVRTGLAAYIKMPRMNLDEAQLHELLTALAGTDKYEYEEIEGLVAKFNEMNADQLTVVIGKVTRLYNAPTMTDLVAARDGEGKEDAMLRLKNTISNVYPIKQDDAVAHEWYYDQSTGGVFTVPQAWEQYIIADEEDRNYKEPAM